MATSSSYNYSATAADVASEALEIVGAIPEGGTPNSAQYTGALRKLNMMIKAAIADDLQLWVTATATLFPETAVNTYNLGQASGASHVCSTYNKTTLSAAGATSDTTITVTSITGISDTDVIGIVLTDGTMQWTTVNGVPSGSTVTLTTALTGPAASGNNVYSYALTAKIQRPTKILEIWRHGDNDVDIPIRQVSRAEYDELPYKVYASLAVEAFYNPLIDSGPASSNGVLQIWPEFSDLTTLIQFRYLRPLQNVDATTDEFDFPQEWFEALALGLAYRLSWNYGMDTQSKYLLKKDANEAWARALNWSEEVASVFLEPDYTANQGFL